jgi:hypothetical protein
MGDAVVDTLGPDTLRAPDTLIVRHSLRPPEPLVSPNTLIVRHTLRAPDALAVPGTPMLSNTLLVDSLLADALLAGTLVVPDVLAFEPRLAAADTLEAPGTLVFEPGLDEKRSHAPGGDLLGTGSRPHLVVAQDARPDGRRPVKPQAGVPLVVKRDSVVRPQGAPMSYACPACDVILYDGIDYLWCPVCSLPVDWVDLSKPFWCCETCDAFVNEEREHWPACNACACPMSRVQALESPPPPPSPSIAVERAAAIGVSVMMVLQLVELAALALDPLGFVIVAPLLLLFVFGAVAFSVAALASVRELVALIRDQRTRSIHGLEHACLNLLERRGCKPVGGQTHDGFFEIEILNDGRASVEAVLNAASEAMTRVTGGESSLAFDPRCGTSLLVGLAVVSVLIITATIAGFVKGIPPGALAASTAIAALLAWWGSRPLGLLAQRTLTVSTKFAAAQVQRIVRVINASGSTATFLVYVHIQLPATTADPAQAHKIDLAGS